MIDFINKMSCEVRCISDEELFSCEDDAFEFDLLKYFKDKFMFKKKKCNNDTKKYLNRKMALYIADGDKCLKKYVYKEAIDNGFTYGIIEFYDFYTTLVKYNETLYWYIKVLNGKYGPKESDKNKKGVFDEYSNIRCLVNASNGKFIYIDKDFDTRNIRIITDDEFLNILYDSKK